MEYRNASYFVEKWGIHERRIRKLCAEGRIEGAVKTGKTWLIPKGARKPLDRRRKAEAHFFCSPIDFSAIDRKEEKIASFRPFPKNVLRQLKEKLLVEWTYNSNAIEGNTLTMSETKAVLENGITIQGKPLKDHLEAINHKEAIEFIQELVAKDCPLTEYRIKLIHNLVLKGIDSENAGKYRMENVLISGAKHVPPTYLQVPAEMQRLMENYQGWAELHPIVRASYLHGEFVRIHPFVDGNGRTARLLMNFELMKAGFQPAIIRNENRAEYYDALDKAHTTGDYTDFISIVKRQVEKSADELLFLFGVDLDKETE